MEPGDSCSDVQNLSAAAALLSPGADTLELEHPPKGWDTTGKEGSTSKEQSPSPLGSLAAGFCQGVCAFPGHGVDLEGAEGLLQKGEKRNNEHDDIVKKRSSHHRMMEQLWNDGCKTLSLF